ncbi:MAG: MFS transporter [Sinobacteraceae bacterium]|nr:MFS transporter [Nevskiaceae bacterium]
MAAERGRTAAWVLVLAIVLLAFNLRIIFPTLSVLLPDIVAQTGLSSAAAGYLTTLPVLCMGVFAPLAPWCAQRIGIEATLLVALLLLAVGTALRGFVGVSGLFVGTALAGAAIAIGNVLLPALAKRDFSQHVATLTGVYVMAMYVGASLAAATTVPLARQFDLGGLHGWSLGVAIWALPAVAVALVWLPRLRHSSRGAAPAAGKVTGLWRDALAWQVTLFMGLQSALAYCAVGWAAPIVRSRGLDASQAGLAASVIMVATIVGSLGAPVFMRWFSDQRFLCVTLNILTGGALLGLLLAPLWSVWGWAALEGFASGSLFAVALTVIGLRSRDSDVATRLSGMAQSVGYIVAAGGPLMVGLLLDWTGSFAASGWLFAAVAAGGAISGWGAGRRRYVLEG